MGVSVALKAGKGGVGCGEAGLCGAPLSFSSRGGAYAGGGASAKLRGHVPASGWGRGLANCFVPTF